jgi:hypothetical protein
MPDRAPLYQRFRVPMAIAIVLLIILWLVIFLLVRPAETKTPPIEMLIELSKSVGQLIFVALLGGAVSFVYSQYAKEEEHRKTKLAEDTKNRRELLDALIQVRANVEKVRRSYRLLPATEKKDGYKQAIKSLLDSRLMLSEVWHDIQTLQRLYEPDHNTIYNGIQTMKIYLDALIDEYEANGEKIDHQRDEDAIKGIQELCKFGPFVTEDGGVEYTQKYLTDYRSAATLMRQYIVSPKNL